MVRGQQVFSFCCRESTARPAAQCHGVTRLSTRHGVRQLSERFVRFPFLQLPAMFTSLNVRSILGEFDLATHRRQVSDGNDWLANVCNLEIDVDAFPLSLKPDCFSLKSLDRCSYCRTERCRTRSWSRDCSCAELRRACRECCATVDEQSASFFVAVGTRCVQSKHENPNVSSSSWASPHEGVIRESFLTTLLITCSFGTIHVFCVHPFPQQKH